MEKPETYSLAIVVIEVQVPCLAQILVSNSFEYPQMFAGMHPFGLHSDEQTILLLTQDIRPEKPTFASKIWSLAKEYGDGDPEKWPDMLEVLNKFESGEGGFSVVYPPRSSLFKKSTGNNPFMSFSAFLSPLFGSRITLRNVRYESRGLTSSTHPLCHIHDCVIENSVLGLNLSLILDLREPRSTHELHVG